MARISLTALLSLVFLASYAQGLNIGAVTGNNYRVLSRSEQQAWFLGVLDGLMTESLMLPTELKRLGKLEDEDTLLSYSFWLGDCVGRFELEQLEAIFRQKLEAEPESWHAPAALVVRRAMVDFCKPEHAE